jgi:hypothetical protein
MEPTAQRSAAAHAQAVRRANISSSFMNIQLLFLFIIAISGGSMPNNQCVQDNQFTGFIAGRVIDNAGNPIKNANVCANPYDLAWTGPIPCDVTSNKGTFKLVIWRPGTYEVSAYKEAERYPDNFNPFYGKAFGNLPSVRVIEPRRTYQVEVKNILKAGVLTGKFIDAATGEAIESALVEFCRVSEPHYCWSQSTGFPKGRFRYLTPEVPFKFRVSVYRDGRWQECEIVGEETEALDVEPNHTRVLNARLRGKP